MRLTANTRSALLASGLLALLPTALLAQSATDPAAPPDATTADPMMPDAAATPETQTPVVEERKVDQFAAAFVAVQDIQAQATQELSTAKDEQQATQVKASAEQKMIEAVKEGKQPDARLAARAKLRSKHNTFIVVPTVFLMISNHYSHTYGSRYNWLILSALVLAGWGAAKVIRRA